MLLFVIALFFIIVLTQIGALWYLKDNPPVKQIVKQALCLSLLLILYLNTKIISKSNFAIIGLTIILIGKFYITIKKKHTNTVSNQRLNSEQSDHGYKVYEPEHEFPSNLPPIMSENESRVSSNRSQQEPNTTGRVQENKDRASSQMKLTQKDKQKGSIQLSFLGEFKQSSFQKSQLGQIASIKQSIMHVHPINQNVNLVKYNEEGETKFGIMKTLKSITYDLLEKELEQFQKEPVISRADYPKIQILYESSQHEGSSCNNELQSRQSKLSINQPLFQGNFKEVHTEQSILQTHHKYIKSNKISWLKLFQHLLILIIFSLTIANFLTQDITTTIIFYCYVIIFLLYQITIYSILILDGLEITTQFRECLAWSILIFLPTGLICLVNYFNLENLKFMAWLSIFITSQRLKFNAINTTLIYPFIILLCLGTLFI